jgi:hypothetical protein
MSLWRGWWDRVPIGRRSILVGAHQFFIHPFFLVVRVVEAIRLSG